MHTHTEERVQRASERAEREQRLSRACIPVMFVAAPASVAGSDGSDYTSAGRGADACALVDGARTCAGPRSDDDDEGGSWFSGTGMAGS
jgi:hypothetical protein